MNIFSAKNVFFKGGHLCIYFETCGDHVTSLPEVGL